MLIFISVPIPHQSCVVTSTQTTMAFSMPMNSEQWLCLRIKRSHLLCMRQCYESSLKWRCDDGVTVICDVMWCDVMWCDVKYVRCMFLCKMQIMMWSVMISYLILGSHHRRNRRRVKRSMGEIYEKAWEWSDLHCGCHAHFISWHQHGWRHCREIKGFNFILFIIFQKITFFFFSKKTTFFIILIWKKF